MTAAGPIRATSDEADRLIVADEMLAALQVRMGGAFPGTIALPGLLALVRKVRMTGVPLAARLTIEDEGQRVSFRASATPDGNGARMEITDWHLASHDAPFGQGAPDEALLRQLAEAHIVLDAEQRVISGMVDAADLADLAGALRQGFGRYWTDLVGLRGTSHQLPLHWRLLDDADVIVAGSERRWKARLLPLRAGGFELLLIADTVLSSAEDAVAAPSEKPASELDDEAAQASVETGLALKGLLGRNLAPALRQPINRIIANAETIRTRLAGPLDGQYVGYAGDIAEAGRHLLSLVEDLADLETVEDAGFAPAEDPIDLADCARRAAGILGVRAREQAITLAVPDADTTVPAIGEFRRVLQILLNLIGNAIRYTPGGTTITLDAGLGDNMAWVSVSDEGEGIAPDVAERVFDKFERLGRSNDGGSGLGLYISRKLARAMGGDLALGPAPHGGARFVLTLRANSQPI